MNRQYKFRAWDKVNKKMMYNGFAIKSIGQSHMDGGVLYDPKFFKKYNPFEIEFMQFTGVSTNDGVEIYEGDFVTHPDFKAGSVLTIGFKNGCFNMSGWDFFRTDATLCKVVGDIYRGVKK